MFSFTKSLIIIVILGLFTGINEKCYAQEKQNIIEIESSVGAISFDKNLSFDLSPVYGLGVGYFFTSYLYASLSIAMSPTQQKVSLATSDLTIKYLIYNYYFNLRVIKPDPILFIIKPFVNIGAGGMSIVPQKSSKNFIDVGGGQKIPLELSTDHKFVYNLGAGFALQMMSRLQLMFEYQRFLYELDLDDGINRKKITAGNDFWGLKLSVSL